MSELNKILTPIDEALSNLKDNYPNKDKVHRAFGQLMGYLNYTPPKMTTVLDSNTGIITLRK